MYISVKETTEQL